MGRGTHSEQTHDFPFRKCGLNQTSSVEKNKDSLLAGRDSSLPKGDHPLFTEQEHKPPAELQDDGWG